MIAYLDVPAGTDISIVESQYPDLWLIEANRELADEKLFDCYLIGDDDAEEDSEDEFLKYNDAVEFIGFAEGAIQTGSAFLDGNGGWAEGMIRRKSFSEFAVDEETKGRWKKISDNYWAAYERGKKARAK